MVAIILNKKASFMEKAPITSYGKRIDRFHQIACTRMYGGLFNTTIADICACEAKQNVPE